MRRLCLATLLFMAVVPAAAEPARLSLSIKLTPAATLPGIPVSLDVAFGNSGRDVVPVPTRIVLVARPAGGDAFLAATMAPEDFEGARVTPGRIEHFTFSVDGTLGYPPIFGDPRLSQPGSYEIQAYAGDRFAFPEQFPSGAALAKLLASATVSSDAVILRVEEPRGDDAAVWALMTVATDGRWHQFVPGGSQWPALAADAVARYPRSQYVPWFVTTGFDATDEARAERLRRALADSRDADPLREWRIVRVAEWELAAARRHGRIDREKCRQATARAAAAIRPALAGMKNQAARESARALLDEIEALEESGKP